VISLQPPCSEPIIYEDLSTININLKSFCYRYPLFFESRLGDGLLLTFAFIQSKVVSCIQRASLVKPTTIKPKDPSSPASFAKLESHKFTNLLEAIRILKKSSYLLLLKSLTLKLLAYNLFLSWCIFIFNLF
jgi:hypothetical protein